MYGCGVAVCKAVDMGIRERMQRWRDGHDTPRGVIFYVPDLPDVEDDAADDLADDAAEDIADDGVPATADPGAAAILGRCSDLRRWAQEAGVALTDTPASLAELDGCLDRWRADGQSRPWLPIEVGLYLGTVLVHHHEGAHWETHDDGRPVIALTDEYEVDVVDLAHDCVTGQTTLTDTYVDIIR